jgi:hypothetical protein
MKALRSLAILLVAAAASAACEKNAVQLIAGPPEGGAAVKFFNFAVGAPNVNFFANDTKVTAVAATGCYLLTAENQAACTTTGLESTTGVAYGGAGNGGNAWYSDVAPGQYTLSGRIAAATDKNLSIANAQANVESGKFYSFYLSGIYNTTTKSAEAFIVEDKIPALDYSQAYVRFVHAMSNANPMTLYAKDRVAPNTEVAIGAQVSYKGAGEFTAIPPGSYDLSTRYAGLSTNAITRTAVGFAAGRVYTITARGNINTASTILLDNTANR